jgi:hypothetical protein
MAYLNTCAELDDLGKGRYRHVQHLRPIAYLKDGVYRLTSRNVVAYDDGTYHHAVLTANLGVRIGDDGRYAIHPTRELNRYAALGGPMIKTVNGWQSVGFESPVRQGQSVVWQRAQADLKLTHIGHGLKHEIWLKDGYVPPQSLMAYPVDLVGLTWNAGRLLADGEVVVRSSSTTISQTPTVTAGAYAANDAVGGLLTFANAARATGGVAAFERFGLTVPAP